MGTSAPKHPARGPTSSESRRAGGFPRVQFPPRTVDLEDHGGALRAGPGVALQQRVAGGGVGVAHVFGVVAFQLGLAAVLAHPGLARAAAPGGAEEAAAAVHGAGAHKLAALAAGGAVCGIGGRRLGVVCLLQARQPRPPLRHLARQLHGLLLQLAAADFQHHQLVLQRLPRPVVDQHVLAGGQQRHLAVQQHLFAVVLVLAEQPGLGQVRGQHLAVHVAAAAHALRVALQREQVRLQAPAAALGVAVGAHHALALVQGVLVAAHRALAMRRHCIATAASGPDRRCH